MPIASAAGAGAPMAYPGNINFGAFKAKIPRREPTAVQDAFLENQSALKRFISRFFRSVQDVEDVAQETFLRAYRAESGKSIARPKAFLFRIAKHIALNQLSRKSRQITDYLEDLGDSDVIIGVDSLEDEMVAHQAVGLHCEAIAALTPHCRRVYMLRKVHGMSQKEIASSLGIAVSTVEKHLIKGVAECGRYIRGRHGAERRASN
jgi:RNA polymerase sigma factor (sigma-70 family)